MKGKFEIVLILSVVFLLAGISLLGTSKNPWAIFIGLGLIVLSWALALKTGATIEAILKEKEEKEKKES